MQEVVITDADSRSKYVPLGEGQIDTLLSLAIYALDEQATACGIIE